MKHTCVFDGIALEIEADEVSTVDGGAVLTGAEVSLVLPFEPVRFYRHGWQSWSLTTWQGADERIPRLKLAIHVPMRDDPATAHDGRSHGSWIGAVELADDRIALLGSIDLDAHVAMEARRLGGWSEGGPVRWLVVVGGEEGQDVINHRVRRIGVRVLGEKRRVEFDRHRNVRSDQRGGDGVAGTDCVDRVRRFELPVH